MDGGNESLAGKSGGLAVVSPFLPPLFAYADTVLKRTGEVLVDHIKSDVDGFDALSGICFAYGQDAGFKRSYGVTLAIYDGCA